MAGEELNIEPIRKGRVYLAMWGYLDDRAKCDWVLGRFRIKLPPIGRLPEFRARVVSDTGGNNFWVLLPATEQYYAVKGTCLKQFLREVLFLFGEGESGMFLYTNDDLVYRTCLLWIGGKVKNAEFLDRMAELIKERKTKEARALLIAKEL
jgi:hypothetical protein